MYKLQIYIDKAWVYSREEQRRGRVKTMKFHTKTDCPLGELFTSPDLHLHNLKQRPGKYRLADINIKIPIHFG